jgi:hypothetical protein
LKQARRIFLRSLIKPAMRYSRPKVNSRVDQNRPTE